MSRTSLKAALLFSSLFFLVSCAVSPSPFSGPNGKPAYSMNCSGMGRDLNDCYQKAGELCPNGYTIVGKDSGMVAVPVNGSFIAAPQHHMAIECK